MTTFVELFTNQSHVVVLPDGRKVTIRHNGQHKNNSYIVALGIDAPRDVRIMRSELLPQVLGRPL